MKIKKWLFLIIILSSSTHAASLSKQNFAAWLNREMAHKHISGVSIAIVKNYQIEWAKGFGMVNKKTPEPVTPNILFQAGSISKSVTAMAAMKLVQDGKLTLDENINNALVSWKLPDNSYTNKDKVTLKQLLSHTAGTNVPGFPGYAKGEKPATLIEILNGAQPANSEAIRVVERPGRRFKYSGGGYIIVQQALMDVQQQSFNHLMDWLILKPLEMNHSTFQQPLPTKLMNSAAVPYWTNGRPVPGGPHTYPEQAAAGLWTTPTDLARFMISLQKSLRGDTDQLLSKQSAELMVINSSPNTMSHPIGLGFTVNANKYGKSAAHGTYFTAMGQNAGYSSLLMGSSKNGNGLVIMINASPNSRIKSDKTSELISAVVKKIVQTGNWN